MEETTHETALVIVLDEDELALVKRVVDNLFEILGIDLDIATGVKVLLIAFATWCIIRKSSRNILREIASLADIYIDVAKICKHRQNVKNRKFR